MENKNFIKRIQELGKDRFAICKECPELFHPTAQCKKCGCLMRVKVLMPDQKCPLDKW